MIIIIIVLILIAFYFYHLSSTVPEKFYHINKYNEGVYKSAVNSEKIDFSDDYDGPYLFLNSGIGYRYTYPYNLYYPYRYWPYTWQIGLF